MEMMLPLIIPISCKIKKCKDSLAENLKAQESFRGHQISMKDNSNLFLLLR